LQCDFTTTSTGGTSARDSSARGSEKWRRSFAVAPDAAWSNPRPDAGPERFALLSCAERPVSYRCQLGGADDCEPHVCLHFVLYSAIAIHVSQLNLSFPHSPKIRRRVVRCLPVPTGGQRVTLGDAFAILVHLAQGELGVGQSLCGGFA